ncbi:UDP-N-acetylmuramoyl-L-alanyl-D-glutamate--2,6-diaminopimelate ligase [Acetobacter pasteurianus]|uniref:UDP-N-acetylmuramoyl-L-alanyl-D-glutamate--2,6-diaminopimelate ligase n=1 Tax=Acetobacter pasteurianus TaxID=438 RepID=A0A1A0DJ91_ACEPA|nr:UDP-N-acetylmuramoyl-L-alanyl-D-glutamate--2,6-diaminopimelate ligase [Acetobacter pasteurianus]OAZ75055.1 UDP-N-acetylmuramoyl-L-alanyl-D-glutamate--2,6-diaminopimelate ligase [Acetobacter pasteurianus]RCL10202.1 UDP-N-acetylmuramoyl-L-alanyl-D-glutamate--2,6-diaminopimelate ligase [Acetobacter pasteurianus]GAB29735.1 UDP-N-acetylmuramoylalanyl-D-glutamate--2,6-diaminopimelate ligase [Acetobacter pasteurianus subsp. pasteurianus LMG 1262 = NBRC 106471]GCD50215.1 UDP-N-acetylmuramoylalanyl-D
MSLPLSTLLAAVGLPALPENPEISAITADSRQVKPGTIFAALPGVKTDGRAFIAMAVQNGAAAVLAPTDTQWPTGVPTCPLILAPNPRHALALMAAVLAGPQPQHLVAITGTNGKTSTADFIRQIWALQGFKAAAIGTLGLTGAEDTSISFPALTTPDPVALANGLATLTQAGFNHVALEASSHGLEQGRLDGLHLAAAGFTNLTRDHLDYHLTIEAYRTAKLKLFDTLLPEQAIAVANADMDAQTLQAIRTIAARRNLRLRLVGEQGTTLRLVAHNALPAGQELTIEHNGHTSTVPLPIPGRFQADNVLLAVALAAQDDAEIADILPLLPHLKGVRGRLERATVLPNGACAYVDYAHTPDALARLLASLRPHARGKLVVVLGAGGDRDSGKRPLMGQEAIKGADIAIITDDNPRTENPASIRAEIKAGAPQALEIADRKQAIAEALSMLKADDVLVVAGKGHEQGQIIGNTILPFDDAAVLRTLAGHP